ncbi:helix-turn-helix domain-containing protein [Thioclava nitratireducens]|uniref:helix-turn-helix domain-containing protein n=1 Tax=Thioclava nitratireducens TaxID=1915078 RepID=UPI002480C71B|nr:hypothetical protein [Thioclava nitratireducens]WGT50163.1 hypothetical protein P0N61_17955 [Thioclava nitratireducens]
MARGKFITDFERDCIRIGKARGLENATIARALKRTQAAIGQQVRMMEEDGTLGNLPLTFMVDEIADMMRREGAIQ